MLCHTAQPRSFHTVRDISVRAAQDADIVALLEFRSVADAYERRAGFGNNTFAEVYRSYHAASMAHFGGGGVNALTAYFAVVVSNAFSPRRNKWPNATRAASLSCILFGSRSPKRIIKL